MKKKITKNDWLNEYFQTLVYEAAIFKWGHSVQAAMFCLPRYIVRWKGWDAEDSVELLCVAKLYVRKCIKYLWEKG